MKLLSEAAAFLLLLMAANTDPEVKVMRDMLESPADCTAHLPWGNPEVPGHIQTICKAGYTSFFDLDAKIPRLVAYRETAANTFGCLPRIKNFHTDRSLPAHHYSETDDYKDSGYDLGHNAPDQDMATTHLRLFDSYNLANISPQVPGLNREGWESLEELVRSWALERGEIVIYVGSIMSDTPKVIGRDQVEVPEAFYKVVVDPKTNESIGFIMPNTNIPKGDVSPFIVPIPEIEQRAKIHLPLPDHDPTTIDATKPSLWYGDVKKWHWEHKATCEIGKR